LLGAFILLVCLSDIAWLHLSVAPPRYFDDSQYLAEGVQLYHIFKENGIKEFLKNCTYPSRGGHPPMMKILPMPIYLVSQPTMNSGLYAYTLLIPVFCIHLFLLTRALFYSESIALLAVIITCLFPLTYGLWRNMLAEFGTAVATVACLYHLVVSEEFRVRKHVLLLGAFLGWGLLWKILFPLFVTVPMLYVLIRRVRSLKPEEAGALMRNLALLLAAVGVIAGPFYVVSYQPVLSFMLFSASENGATEMVSLGPVFSPSTLFRYWFLIINHGISVYFFLLLFAFSLLYIALGKKIFPPQARWFLAAWFPLPFLVGSFSIMKELRYMFAIYPVFGIIIFSFDLELLPRKDIRWGPFIISIKDLEMASFEMVPPYAYPANQVKWPTHEVVEMVAKHSRDITEPVAQVQMMAYNPYFNAFVLDYESELSRVSANFYSEIAAAQFLITLTGSGGRLGILDSRDPYVQKLLDDRRLPWFELGRIPLPGSLEAIIYKKSTNRFMSMGNQWRDLMEEMEVYEALDRAAKTDFVIGSDARPVIAWEPNSEIKFKYIYVPDSGALLQWGIGVNEAEVTADCTRTYQVSAGEMSSDPIKSHVLLARIIDPANNPKDLRWFDEVVSLNQFRGKIIELTLTTTSNSPEDTSCNRLGWSSLRMIYTLNGHK
jgi:hypothetical protein